MVAKQQQQQRAARRRHSSSRSKATATNSKHPMDYPFALRVWTALSQVPSGCVTSYKALAGAVGSPLAVRAVGMALSKNPLAPQVPCHRVIASDGSIGGFSGSRTDEVKLKRKRDLLSTEGVNFNSRGMCSVATWDSFKPITVAQLRERQRQVEEKLAEGAAVAPVPAKPCC